MRTEESATGNVAKLLLGAFGVSLGVAYKEKPGGLAEFSLRSTSESKIHLGKEIGVIAQAHGGSGGGHEKAAGCSVPSRGPGAPETSNALEERSFRTRDDPSVLSLRLIASQASASFLRRVPA